MPQVIQNQKEVKGTSVNGAWIQVPKKAIICLALNMACFPATSSATVQSYHIENIVSTNSGLVAKRAYRDTAAAIAEVRHISGLTWEQIASIFSVDRRSLHFWTNGKAMSAQNEEKLYRLLSTLQFISNGSPRDNRDMLLSPLNTGDILLTLLQNNRFDEVRSYVGRQTNFSRQDKPLSAKAKLSRKPTQPYELVDALQNDLHQEKGKLIKKGLSWPKKEA